ncbi:FecCD family ABC transporter permease [Streptomyces iconiensis]|uniref:Iron ABC transporter permease n=1 Tax=Streptomyces iconiensis TaxID=1384038 RepID=A0ABT6ZXL7_9ACTN|nr:iron ABC transporter permease [Streptomyces iconiensis]MDJ1133376.1 iron ABC transporter permease [Streptomyces iconiensis]
MMRPGGSPVRRGALLLGLPLALCALVLSVWASLVVGTGDVSAADVLHGLFSPDLSDKGQLIVQEVRIPRTVTGLLAGVALGLAGAVMQGVARNPLADPGILGVNAGASVAVVLAISVLGLSAPAQFVWFGFLGALVAAVVVYGVGALGREGATPVKLALAGAAMSALLGSFTSAILLTDNKTFDQFRFWQVGALTARGTDVLWQVGPFIVVGALFALLLGPHLNALSLGDDLARGLGQRVGLARIAAAVAVVLLCGGATAVAGPIGFVGLVVPHAARLLTGPDYRWILPYSAVLAPVLLLLADIVGRVIAPPGEVQVGVVTAAIGAVPFIILVRRRRLAEL